MKRTDREKLHVVETITHQYSNEEDERRAMRHLENDDFSVEWSLWATHELHAAQYTLMKHQLLTDSNQNHHEFNDAIFLGATNIQIISEPEIKCIHNSSTRFRFWEELTERIHNRSNWAVCTILSIHGCLCFFVYELEEQYNTIEY